jgi:RsiW-degrading membrane proteinase PrsW (M82 family)
MENAPPPQTPIIAMPPSVTKTVVTSAGPNAVTTVHLRPAGPTPPVALRSSALYWSLFGIAVLLMLLGFFASVGASYLESGPMVILAVVAAILPAPIYLGLFLWLDRFEPEPLPLLILTFLWGAGVAGLLALVLNTTGEFALMQFMAPENAQATAASVIGPIVEETLKGIAVLAIFLIRRRDFDDVLDGIIYAGMAALGFAMVENVGYYGRGMTEGLASFSVTFVLRGIMSPYAHVLFTSMTGIGFGLAAQIRKGILPWILPVVGWLAAITLHATWNTVPLLGGAAFLIAYVIIWIPLFLTVLAVIAFSLRRESKLIRTNLAVTPNDSFLLPTDAEAASRFAPRFFGDVPVLFTGGWTTWNNVRHYQRACTALAFYRLRVSTGKTTPNPVLESYYCGEIARLRPAPKATTAQTIAAPLQSR